MAAPPAAASCCAAPRWHASSSRKSGEGRRRSIHHQRRMRHKRAWCAAQRSVASTQQRWARAAELFCVPFTQNSAVGRSPRHRAAGGRAGRRRAPRDGHIPGRASVPVRYGGRGGAAGAGPHGGGEALPGHGGAHDGAGAPVQPARQGEEGQARGGGPGQAAREAHAVGVQPVHGQPHAHVQGRGARARGQCARTRVSLELRTRKCILRCSRALLLAASRPAQTPDMPQSERFKRLAAQVRA
jgi:hypothetical protein